MKNTKLAAIGVAAGLTVGGAAGAILAVPVVSGAQTTSTAAPDTSTTAPDTPTATADRGSHIADALAPLVADGTITQDQADKVQSALEDAMPKGGPGGPGMGRGGPGMGLDAAATALGISADELRTDLQGGQTIAQVAQAQGVDVQTVIDAMVAQAKAHLDEEVASGEHTQAEADQKLADITTRITDMVNNGAPMGGPGGMRGPGGHHGPDGDADDATTDTTTG